MAGNTQAVWSRVFQNNWGLEASSPLIKTANTAKDGTGTTITLFTADGTNGGRAEKLSGVAAGTNVASVLRLFINNGSSSATPANNSLIGERSLPVTTLSEVAETGAFVWDDDLFPL